MLEALEEYFEFSHTSVLLHDEARTGGSSTMASRGYGESGVGAEVALGDGLIGTVARERRLLRLTSLDADLRYGRAIRREAASAPERFDAEIPLPGLPDAQSFARDPADGRRSPRRRDRRRRPRSDAVQRMARGLSRIIANQIALGIDRMIERCNETADAAPEPASAARARRARTSADAVHAHVLQERRCDLRRRRVPDQNVPAQILWKVLGESQRTGRTEFTNRELRVDSSLGLPPVKDNLESRLILLRHRLQEKCPDLQIVPTGRGRFALRSDAALELIER